jgi:hypothetical protein
MEYEQHRGGVFQSGVSGLGFKSTPGNRLHELSVNFSPFPFQFTIIVQRLMLYSLFYA